MKLKAEYRLNARACLELSRKSSSLNVQAHWLAMAQYWFDLAEDRNGAEAEPSTNKNEGGLPGLNDRALPYEVGPPTASVLSAVHNDP